MSPHPLDGSDNSKSITKIRNVLSASLSLDFGPLSPWVRVLYYLLSSCTLSLLVCLWYYSLCWSCCSVRWRSIWDYTNNNGILNDNGKVIELSTLWILNTWVVLKNLSHTSKHWIFMIYSMKTKNVQNQSVRPQKGPKNRFLATELYVFVHIAYDGIF